MEATGTSAVSSSPELGVGKRKRNGSTYAAGRVSELGATKKAGSLASGSLAPAGRDEG